MKGPARDRLTPQEKFAANTRVTESGCVVWIGTEVSRWYGHLYVNGKRHAAHRLAWEMANGPIPGGLYVCHSCDNPPCVNVDHLFLGTNAENLADMAAKGRAIGGLLRGAENGRAKLDEQAVLAIRSDRSTTNAEFGRRYGVTGAAIYRIRMGLTWKHLLTNVRRGLVGVERRSA